MLKFRAVEDDPVGAAFAAADDFAFFLNERLPADRADLVAFFFRGLFLGRSVFHKQNNDLIQHYNRYALLWHLSSRRDVGKRIKIICGSKERHHPLARSLDFARDDELWK